MNSLKYLIIKIVSLNDGKIKRSDYLGDLVESLINKEEDLTKMFKPSIFLVYLKNSVRILNNSIEETINILEINETYQKKQNNTSSNSIAIDHISGCNDSLYNEINGKIELFTDLDLNLMSNPKNEMLSIEEAFSASENIHDNFEIDNVIISSNSNEYNNAPLTVDKVKRVKRILIDNKITLTSIKKTNNYDISCLYADNKGFNAFNNNFCYINDLLTNIQKNCDMERKLALMRNTTNTNTLTHTTELGSNAFSGGMNDFIELSDRNVYCDENSADSNIENITNNITNINKCELKGNNFSKILEQNNNKKKKAISFYSLLEKASKNQLKVEQKKPYGDIYLIN